MEDDLPRFSGDAAARLSCESLDRYSQDELIKRIALLEAEIARVRAHHARAADRRRLADALFGAGAGPSTGPSTGPSRGQGAGKGAGQGTGPDRSPSPARGDGG